MRRRWPKAMDLDVDHPPARWARPAHPAKPAIAAVDGWCLTGGVELALWCDMQSPRRTTFGLFERRWGAAGDSGTQLPRVVGMGRLELILTGRPVEAEEAHPRPTAGRARQTLRAPPSWSARIATFPQRRCWPTAAAIGARPAASRGDAGASPRRAVLRSPPAAVRFASGEGRHGEAFSRRSRVRGRRASVFGGFRAQWASVRRTRSGRMRVASDPARREFSSNHRGGAADREAGGVGGKFPHPGGWRPSSKRVKRARGSGREHRRRRRLLDHRQAGDPGLD